MKSAETDVRSENGSSRTMSGRMMQRARAAASSVYSSTAAATGAGSPERKNEPPGSSDTRSFRSIKEETAEEAVARQFPSLSFEPATVPVHRNEINTTPSSTSTSYAMAVNWGGTGSVDTSGLSHNNPFDEPNEVEEKQEKSVLSQIEGKTLTFSRTSASGSTNYDIASIKSETITSTGEVPSVPASSVFPLTEDTLAQERILSELGTGRSASWRIPIYGDFEQLQESGVVKRSAFVEFMCGRGHEQDWCEAAFAAFNSCSEETGGLSQFQFLLATSSLTYSRGSNGNGSNARWLSIRQLLIYNLMLRKSTEGKNGDMDGFCGQGVSYTSFANFLQVLSESEESPAYFGISNEGWIGPGGLSDEEVNHISSEGSELNSPSHKMRMRTTLDIMDQSTLAESLAISKVQLASKQEQYEKLELQYLKLEKLHCQLKLELAAVKAAKDGL